MSVERNETYGNPDGIPVVLDPQAFIEGYGPEATVGFDNGMATTLGQALALEDMFCTAGQGDRQDPSKRLGFLATILNKGGSLLPEHMHYLPKPE